MECSNCVKLVEKFEEVRKEAEEMVEEGYAEAYKLLRELREENERLQTRIDELQQENEKLKDWIRNGEQR
jgi:cell fate (sporulation/competence/biofilm development) regulator YlbF (YheA/YmcA/DUF963 family)